MRPFIDTLCAGLEVAETVGNPLKSHVVDILPAADLACKPATPPKHQDGAGSESAQP